MGQRTQIVYHVVNNKGEHRNFAYHNQWGIGRQMPLDLMSVYIDDYKKDTFKKDYSIFDLFSNLKLNEYNLLQEIEDIKEFNKIDFRDIEQAREWFKSEDNNNGGMVVFVKEDDVHYDSAHFQVAFLKGWEEEDVPGGRPFEKWLTPDEYLSFPINANYSDEKFRAMFNAFLEYFDISVYDGTNSIL